MSAVFERKAERRDHAGLNQRKGACGVSQNASDKLSQAITPALCDSNTACDLSDAIKLCRQADLSSRLCGLSVLIGQRIP
mgnify:CR=1 FL=1